MRRLLLVSVARWHARGCQSLSPTPSGRRSCCQAVPAAFAMSDFCNKDFRAELYRLDLERLESEQRLQAQGFTAEIRLKAFSHMFSCASGSAAGRVGEARLRLPFVGSAWVVDATRLPALQGGVSPELQLCSVLRSFEAVQPQKVSGCLWFCPKAASLCWL